MECVAILLLDLQRRQEHQQHHTMTTALSRTETCAAARTGSPMKKRGAPRCWAALAVVALVVGAASLLARIPEIEVGTTRCRATPRQPLTTARRTTTRDFGKKTLGPVPLLLNARFDGWSGLKPQQIMYQVTIKLARPEMPSSMPGDVRSLMQRGWSADPDARPNFAEIVRELRTTTPKRPA